MTEPSLAYYAILAYIIYIIGLTAVPATGLILEYLKKIKTGKEFKYIKRCSLGVWLKNRLLIPQKPKEQLSLAFLLTGVGSIFFSVIIMMVSSFTPCEASTLYNQILALFVGLWAPNLILLSLYLKK